MTEIQKICLIQMLGPIFIFTKDKTYWELTLTTRNLLLLIERVMMTSESKF